MNKKNIILVSSTGAVLRNQVGRKKRTNLVNGIYEAAISDLFLTLGAYFWSNSTLVYLGPQYISLKFQIRGYKQADSAKKHQMEIPSQLFQFIYDRVQPKMSTLLSFSGM